LRSRDRVLDQWKRGKIFARIPPAGGIDVEAFANRGGLLAQRGRQRGHQLVESAFRGGAEAGMTERAGLRHQQRLKLALIQAGHLRAPALLKFPSALRAAQRHHGHPRRAQRFQIAMDGALRDFEPLGQLALGGAAPGLEEQEHGKQAVGFHAGRTWWPFITFSICRINYDIPCHI
jgi:hypothetical protein